MPAPVRLRVLGLRLDIRCVGANAEALADAVADAWERCQDGHGSDALSPSSNELTVSADPLTDREVTRDAENLWAPLYANSIPELLHHLSSRVTALAIESEAGRSFLFHAGAVAMGDGTVAGFIGASGAGKTTLMSHLARAYGYVTDETLCVRPGGEVIPYPKALSLITGDSVKHQASPSQAGLAATPRGSLALGSLFLIERRPHHEPKLEEVPVLWAIAEIGSQMSYLPRMEKPLQSLATLVESVGGVRRLVYGEAAEVPEFLGTLQEVSS